MYYSEYYLTSMVGLYTVYDKTTKSKMSNKQLSIGSLSAYNGENIYCGYKMLVNN